MALVGLMAVAVVLWHSATSVSSVVSDTKRLVVHTGAGGTDGYPVAPARFSPGACVSFPPTAGGRHQTVFVDAGHGGIDPGAVGVTESGQTIHEADLTLPVELDVMGLAASPGFHRGRLTHRRHLGGPTGA